MAARADPLKGRPVSQALAVTVLRTAAKVKVKERAKAKVVAPETGKVAVSKAKDLGKAPAKGAKAARKEAVVEWAEVQEAEAAPTRHRQIYLTAAMTTSLRVSFVRPQCRSKILSCARNCGRSTAITRRARVNCSREELFGSVRRLTYDRRHANLDTVKSS